MMNEPPIIHFDAFDLQIINMLAERQHAVKATNNVRSKKHDDKKSEFELHYIGSMGEFAVARYCKTGLNTELHIGGDNGIDTVVNGIDCHIKTFTYGGSDPEVYIDYMECFTTPVGIFTRILSPTRVMITGCIGKDRFERIHSIKGYGHGDRLMVSERNLSHIDDLMVDNVTIDTLNERH
jgi:hypothetical protein